MSTIDRMKIMRLKIIEIVFYSIIHILYNNFIIINIYIYIFNVPQVFWSIYYNNDDDDD
jgi:hypothetical protein